jgi:hypothetical protein
MQVTFFGLRGSCPAPGPKFIKYGGNTACLHFCLDDGTDIILDAGTGIKNLGQELIKKMTTFTSYSLTTTGIISKAFLSLRLFINLIEIYLLHLVRQV